MTKSKKLSSNVVYTKVTRTHMSRADAELINSVVTTGAHIDVHENRIGCFVVHDLTGQKL